MKLYKLTAVALVLALILSGCSFLRLPSGSAPSDTNTLSSSKGTVPSKSSAGSQLTLGEFEGNTYYNDYFGISFSVPNGWIVATRAQIQQIFGEAAKAFSSSLDQTQILYLTLVTKNALGTAGNPNINMVAENISGVKTIKTPSDYLEASKALLEQTGKGYTFDDIETATLSGSEFALMHMKMDYQGTETYQTQICTLRKNYALVFTFTYYTEDEMNEMSDISDTIEVY